MTVSSKQLSVKRSTLPGAGKGLFTRVFIPKGTWIVEYKGVIRSWKDIDPSKAFNGYILYVKRNHVIDAKPYKQAKARYANDARGLFRKKGIVNNAQYEQKGLSIFIVATKNIPAGAEIFVDYGKEYWQSVRYNLRHAGK